MPQSVFNSLYERWRRMSAIGRIMAIGAVCVSVLYGGGKGENRNVANVGMLPIANINSQLENEERETHSQAIPTNINMSSTRAKSWNVRGAWDEFNSEQGDLPLGIIPKRYDQTFSINNEGTLSISKFGHIVSRGTNNVFHLNGTIVDKNNLIKKD